jgi:drug/metabolite transporter (DMT)-like permease
MALFWASSYPLGRHLAQFEMPVVVVWLRLLFATGFLMLIAGARGGLATPLTPRLAGQFLLLGASGFCVHNLLMMKALEYTRANAGAVLNGAIPLVIVVLDFLLFRRRIPRAGLTGVALGFLGTAVVATRGDPGALPTGGIGHGEALFLVAVCGWAVYSMAARPLFASLSPLAVTTWCCAAGLLLLTPAALLQIGTAAPLLTDSRLMAFVAVQAFASMTLGFLWYSQGVQAIGAMNTAMYSNLVPVFAIVLAALTLGETPDLPVLLGAALVIAGLVVVNRAQRSALAT